MNLKKTILVVDDEPVVGQFLAIALEVEGYSILQADTIKLAVDILNAHDGINLIITDQCFLNKPGRRIAERILRARPYLKVLHISGKPRQLLIDEGSLSPDDVFLEKPFLANALITKVRELFDANNVEQNTSPRDHVTERLSGD